MQYLQYVASNANRSNKGLNSCQYAYLKPLLSRIKSNENN